MCRLLGYVSRQALAVQDAVGPAAFAEFTALTKVHGDGWGMAWSDDQGDLHRATSPTSAAADDDYARLASQPLGRSGLVHLRWATDGLAVDSVNTHPFLEPRLALAHNGHVSPIADLEALLTPQSRAALAGTTDSERYFRFVVQQLTEGTDEVQAVRSAVERLLATFTRSSMNALILTPRRLIAVHASSAAEVPLADLEELFPGLDSVPLDHVQAYFQMRYREDDDKVVVTSTGMSDSGWTDMPHNSLLVVDRQTLAVEQIELSLPAHLRA